MITIDENLNEVDDGLGNEPEGYWNVDDVPQKEGDQMNDNVYVRNVEDEKSSQYVIDFDKVHTLEHVITIIKAMNLHFVARDDGKGQFEEIFPLFKKPEKP